MKRYVCQMYLTHIRYASPAFMLDTTEYRNRRCREEKDSGGPIADYEERNVSTARMRRRVIDRSRDPASASADRFSRRALFPFDRNVMRYRML